MDRYTFRGEMEPTCHTSQARRPYRCGRPCQERPALPCATSSVLNTCFPVCTTSMNEIYQGNVSLIKWIKLWSLGSMGPPLRMINRHDRHSKTILSVTERRRFIPLLRGGPTAPRGLTAPPNSCADRNRLKLLTFNRLRRKDEEHPSQ
jgi:hypothetical protein